MYLVAAVDLNKTFCNASNSEDKFTFFQFMVQIWQKKSHRLQAQTQQTGVMLSLPALFVGSVFRCIRYICSDMKQLRKITAEPQETVMNAEVYIMCVGMQSTDTI